MQSWLGKKLVGYTMRELNAGNIKPTLRMEARDIELTFPGESSFSGVMKGKPAVRAWLERFAELGIQIFADEVLVKGLPWRTTVCVRGHNYLDGPEGERVYDNRYVIWGLMKWGRLRRYEVYEDTQKPVELDRWLEGRERHLTAA
jgi:ketosteroid isomerase-like protein